jgi:crossover junction endodeoxyribonuclease RusA
MTENNTSVNLILNLPYPPSVNGYWGFKGHRRFLTKKAVEFKALVAYQVLKQRTRFNKDILEMRIVWHPPDRRIRDIDNPIKPLLDALTQAGLFEDDCQIRKLHIEFGAIIKGGKTTVVLKPLLL